jgi:hypothetical protein
MKKFSFFFLILFFASKLFSQSPNDTATVPYWIDMMQNYNINYYTTVSAFDRYYENRPVEPHTGYKIFKRWQEFWRTRVDEQGNFPAADAVWKAYFNYFGNNSSTTTLSLSGNWVPLGPTTLPGNYTGQPNGNGRISSIAFHPTDANTFWVGTPQGGLWGTTNGGVTWTSNTDNLPSLGVSSILVDPSNTNIMYIGSGDRDAGDSPGMGVLKTTNGGNTWVQINSGLGNYTVGMMAMNRYNSNIIIAATSNGIYKTINAGANWVKKSGNSNNYKDIKYHPSDTNIVYAVENGIFYLSTDAGNTFTVITAVAGTNLPVGTRAVIGVSPAAPDYVYVVLASGTYKGTYLSRDKGHTFMTKSTTPNLFDYSYNGSGTGTQAWYDMAAAVDTANFGTIYVGGINIFKSTDSGATWTCYGQWVGSGGPPLHADQHQLVIDPKTDKIYCGNDGGLYSRSNTASSFTNLTSGLNISQIYRIGQSAQSAGIVIAGWQDNGTGFYRNSIAGTNKWRTTMGGDGMECIIDPTDSNYMYGALYYGNISKTTSGSTLASTVANTGSFGINETGEWITPYTLHNKNPDIMFVGYKNLWRGVGIKGNSPIWTRLTKSSSSNIIAIEHCEGDTSRLYYSRKDARFYRTDSLYLDTPRFKDMTSKTPNPSAVVNWIETHPSKPSTVYIIQGNSIYRSNDTANTWTNINGTLPNVTRNCLLLDKQATDGIYVGTDLGVFYRDSTMSDWVPFKTNLPINSRITELEMYYDYANTSGCRISAGTYGRGLWQSDVYLTNSAPQTDFFADNIACTGKTISLLDLTTGNPDFWQWTISPSTYSFVNGTDANSQNPQLNFNSTGSYTVKLYTRRKGWGYSTLEKTNYVQVGSSTLTASASSTAVCKGTPVVLSASGTLAFAWYDGNVLVNNLSVFTVTPSVTKTYKVVGSNGTACMDSVTITIVVYPLPTISILPLSAKIAAGQTISLTASGATYYSWSPGTGLNTTTGASVNASPTTPTTYTVTGTDDYNCINTQTVSITLFGAGIAPSLSKKQVYFQPNPAHNEVNITVPLNSKLNLYDLTGKVVFVKDLPAGTSTILVEQLPKGLYTAEVLFGDEKFYSKLVLR